MKWNQSLEKCGIMPGEMCVNEQDSWKILNTEQ